MPTEAIIDRLEILYLEEGYGPRQIRKAMADHSGITKQAVGDWFNGVTKNISNEHLASMAQALGASLDYIIRGIEPKYLTGSKTSPNSQDEELRIMIQVSSLFRGLDDPAQKRLATWLWSKYGK